MPKKNPSSAPRRGTPRDTSKANAARRDPLGRTSAGTRILAPAEVVAWFQSLSPAERGAVVAEAYRLRRNP